MSWRTLRKLAALAVLSCARADGGLWSTAYYAGWVQQHLPAAEVDFGALTHVIHFAVVPNSDGSLDSGINLVTAAHSDEDLATEVTVPPGPDPTRRFFRVSDDRTPPP